MDNLEQIRAGHRRFRKAQTVSTGNTRMERLDLEEEEEDAFVETRRRIRENVLRRQKEEDEEEHEEEEEEEYEYEYESDLDDQPGITMLIPVFVIRSERDTIAQRQSLEAQELEDLSKERLKKRKIETKKIVAEEIRKDGLFQKNNIRQAPDMIAEDIDMNEAEEYETWRVREIARIKRDRDHREAMVKDKEEIARRRSMTELLNMLILKSKFGK